MVATGATSRRLGATHAHLATGLHNLIPRATLASASASADLAGNPLMANREMPRFMAIDHSHVEPAVTALLAQQELAIEALEKSVDALGGKVRYDDVFVPMEQLLAPLGYAFGLVGHLMAVKNSDDMRAAHAAAQPAVVASGSRIAQSEPLYKAMKTVSTSGEALDNGQRRAVEAGMRDAELGGVALEGAAKERFNEIQQRMASLSTTFGNNVLDATTGWSMDITDPAELDGLPPSTLALAAQNSGVEGATADAGPYKLTLDMPVLIPVMTYANSRSLRQTIYMANLTKVAICI